MLYEVITFFIDVDHQHLCRAEGFCNIDRRVGIPLDDVDLFVVQLIDDALYARAALADACTDRIDLHVRRMYSNLGAEARFARDGFDLHDAGLNLRHFQLKESLDEAGMRATDQNLRSFAVLAHRITSYNVCYTKLLREVLTAIVQRVEKGNVYVELGKTDGILTPNEMIPGETYENNDRIKVYVLEVRKDSKGPQVV